MPKLFHRVAAVTVDTLKITGLRVEFKVVKTSRPEPNSAEVTIYNISADHRRKMQVAGVPVLLEAGYESAPGQSTMQQLFLGDMRVAGHKRHGVDWVTKLEAGDGEKTLRTSKLTESFAAGTRKDAVVKRMLESMKLNVKDAVAKIGEKGLQGAAEEFYKGISLSGSTAAELTRVLDDMGLTWSVQDGAVQITKPGEIVGDLVVLTPATGLVGSPEAGEKGYVKVRSLLNPLIKPSGGIALDSEAFKGTFRVEKATYSGDTHGAPWFVDAEVVPV